ncbi:class 1 fructose-bisphosphatase [Natrinema salifodinae]|uniref:Fructose-1,6-bisphosphatase class 1 n=1 Tax=Natrinema salifodinae TaxID=1202768 RepID=A0A1I0P928_9EURY|nr:class 1 fructose-bisphosphatase [Natrinema salifodinae]SEW10716.1 fructose-1,6-bisphosphatase I [Natrinema salifodinae]
MTAADADADHEPILDAVATVAADVPAELPRLRGHRGAATATAAVAGDDGQATDERNPTGDDQSAADRWLDDRFREALAPLEAVGAYASEERADVLDCGRGGGDEGGYGVAIDPLDGSDNLAANGPIGTVLGIYDAPLPARGTDLVASAIVIFGPTVTMTVAADGDVVRYRVDEDEGERTDPRRVSLASERAADGADNGDEIDGVCGYSGRREDLSPALLGLVDAFRAERRLRYCGAAVADVVTLLEHGGVLCYPRTDRRPDGVLRLQYEANPIAHIVETAGGRAIGDTGTETDADTEPGRLRQLDPTALHERVPVFVGSPEPIARVESSLGSE